jgi:hypothetical protein
MMPPKNTGLLGKLLLLTVCLVLLPIVIVALPVGIATGVFTDFKTGRDRRAFLAKWAPRRTMLIYSNSPVWQSYIEANWLPRIGPEAVVLNWSERSTWAKNYPLEARLFRSHLGDREFNPAAIVFHRKPLLTPWQSLLAGRFLDALLLVRKDATVIRFWAAFRDFKHGRDSSLRAKEAEMFTLMAAETSAT